MIDVILPLYNNQDTLDETLASVVGQTLFQQVVVHVADDCSDDRSAVLAEAWAWRHPNIHLHRNPSNLGVRGNYDRLLALCRADFVAPIEGDDVWHMPDRLEKLTGYLARSGRPACFSGFLVDDRIRNTKQPGCASLAGRYRRLSVYDMLEKNPPASFSNCVYRRTALADAFALADGRVGYDWLINSFIAARHDGFDYVPDILSTYRVRPSSAWWSLTDQDRVASMISTLSGMRDVVGTRLRETIEGWMAQLGRQTNG